MAAPRTTASQVAGLTGSTGSTTLVLVVLLVALGLVMVATAVWLVRSTRTDAPALAPLEVMGGRRWWKAPEADRQAALDAARPQGALPPAPMLPEDDEPEAVEPVGAEDGRVPAATSPDPVDRGGPDGVVGRDDTPGSGVDVASAEPAGDRSGGVDAPATDAAS